MKDSNENENKFIFENENEINVNEIVVDENVKKTLKMQVSKQNIVEQKEIKK
jgi:hypothetical protein